MGFSSLRRGVALLLVLLALPVVAGAETLRVGVTGGPHAAILEQVAALAAREGLTIKVVEFDDYQLPNAALAQGDLDANSFQHQPFLDEQIRAHGYPLAVIGRTVVFPIGLYSKRIRALDALGRGDKVAIPADPTNGGRVLLLLEAQGLIRLRPGVGIAATPFDVIDNPRGIKLVELPAAQLPRALDDVAVAAINSNYALEVGLVPHRDALVLESADSPYANVIAVRAAERDRPALAQLVRFYHAPEIRRFITEHYGASVVPAW